MKSIIECFPDAFINNSRHWRRRHVMHCNECNIASASLIGALFLSHSRQRHDVGYARARVTPSSAPCRSPAIFLRSRCWVTMLSRWAPYQSRRMTTSACVCECKHGGAAWRLSPELVNRRKWDAVCGLFTQASQIDPPLISSFPRPPCGSPL